MKAMTSPSVRGPWRSDIARAMQAHRKVARDGVPLKSPTRRGQQSAQAAGRHSSLGDVRARSAQHRLFD